MGEQLQVDSQRGVTTSSRSKGEVLQESSTQCFLKYKSERVYIYSNTPSNVSSTQCFLKYKSERVYIYSNTPSNVSSTQCFLKYKSERVYIYSNTPSNVSSTQCFLKYKSERVYIYFNTPRKCIINTVLFKVSTKENGCISTAIHRAMYHQRSAF